MKYGEQFESESVPQWSLHNIDYNSLKHHIKVHTTKDQATAITIPGHQDAALQNFEDGLYEELCRQHDRVDLFVSSKADEIARRLQHLSSQIHRLLIRCASSRREGMSLKRQQRFAKHENNLLQCRDDIQSLQRFVSAQVVAFRKILKKYRKWTGSSTLGSRFRDTVLSHPKSFTRRDFSQLQAEHDNLLATLRAAVLAADSSGTATPASISTAPSIHTSEAVSPSEPAAAPEAPHQVVYWNEYDHGSEAGDAGPNLDSTYAIYINPDEDTGFPGIATLTAFFKAPIETVNQWVSNSSRASGNASEDEEQARLLPPSSDGYGSVNSSYFSSHVAVNSDTEAEDESPAMSGRRGYKPYYAAVPSIREQHLVRSREGVLCWGTWACFAASFALMGIAAILIKTGRHRMRLEVDAGLQTWFPTAQTPIIISAPMLGAANANLAAAVSQAGGIGMIPGGLDFTPSSPHLKTLTSSLLTAREYLSLPTSEPLPVGVGFLLFHPSLSQFTETALPILTEHKVKAVFFFAPSPSIKEEDTTVKNIISALHEKNIIVFFQVGNVAAARKAIEDGADVIVAQGVDAGGHQFVAGSGVFLVADEADTPEYRRKLLIETEDGGVTTAKSTVHDDIQGTPFWPAPYDGRALAGDSYKDHVSGLPIAENIKKYSDANQSGDTSRLVTWVGTGVGLVRNGGSAADIVRDIRKEAVQTLRRVQDLYP
ncbi:hypothetical protein QBC34DRAFT_449825 [Podospora aff. communis PSN243]|uniref:SPX domain-containing protein n=1 Tax=Podospora aff. communis PSN243 TaxID=3040156 RepID=A0AAV9GKL5_9PEZI|nr:hypothetical protein QBC34DRAFT_449825 [Podospora aff. communis PSN243]